MPLKLLRFVLLLALIVLPWSPAAAQHAPRVQHAPAAPDEKEAGPPRPVPEMLVETSHTATIGGRPIAYKALAGELGLADEAGKPKARMFYVAYLKDTKGEERGRRPLTFVWNGGPGSAAVWLHLGAFGPKRVDVDEEGVPAPPPYRLVPNDNSLLDVTDLVFVDPVSTGFSRPAPGESAEQFHNVEADVRWVGELVRLFVTRHGRWGSPLFLLGESYGGVRASVLADYLQRRFHLYLNGVVLIAPALSMQTYLEGGLNDLPYILSLPSHTAAAWYHKKLPPDLQADLQKAVREAEDFALGDYDDALLRGAALPEDKRKEIAARLARLTGIAAEDIEKQHLRLDSFTFAGKLLEKERRQIGVLDSRYWGYVNWMAAEATAPAYAYGMADPSYSRVDGLFAGAFHQYLRDDLGVRNEAVYETLSIPTAASWNYRGAENRYLFPGDNLRAAMTLNTDLEVFVATGTYDMVITPFATRYVLDHLELAPELRKNLTFVEYPGGHMMYLHQPSLVRLKQDLAAFYQEATAR